MNVVNFSAKQYIVISILTLFSQLLVITVVFRSIIIRFMKDFRDENLKWLNPQHN